MSVVDTVRVRYALPGLPPPPPDGWRAETKALYCILADFELTRDGRFLWADDGIDGLPRADALHIHIWDGRLPDGAPRGWALVFADGRVAAARAEPAWWRPFGAPGQEGEGA